MSGQQVSHWREPGDKRGRYHLKIDRGRRSLCGIDLTLMWPIHVGPLDQYTTAHDDCKRCVRALRATHPTDRSESDGS